MLAAAVAACAPRSTAADNMQQPKTQHATAKTQHATYQMQHATSKTQHAIAKKQWIGCGLQHTTAHDATHDYRRSADLSSSEVLPALIGPTSTNLTPSSCAHANEPSATMRPCDEATKRRSDVHPLPQRISIASRAIAERWRGGRQRLGRVDAVARRREQEVLSLQPRAHLCSPQ